MSSLLAPFAKREQIPDAGNHGRSHRDFATPNKAVARLATDGSDLFEPERPPYM